jgi:hypothetical protein
VLEERERNALRRDYGNEGLVAEGERSKQDSGMLPGEDSPIH